MKSKKNSIFLSATILLGISIASNLYLYETKERFFPSYIEINGTKVCLKDLGRGAETITIHNSITNENYTGVPLDKIIEFAGVKNPENHSYVIIGANGYRKTVKWEDMMRGVLTEEGRVAFEHLPKAFMVKKVVKIEVV